MLPLEHKEKGGWLNGESNREQGQFDTQWKCPRDS